MNRLERTNIADFPLYVWAESDTPNRARFCDPMKRERISLGIKEQKGAFLLNQPLSRVVEVGEAAQLFGLSPRQIKRLKATYGLESERRVFMARTTTGGKERHCSLTVDPRRHTRKANAGPVQPSP
jgi:hypothetical protein